MRSGQKEERGKQGVTKLQTMPELRSWKWGVQRSPARLWFEALCEALKGGRGAGCGYVILQILTAMHVLC